MSGKSVFLVDDERPSLFYTATVIKSIFSEFGFRPDVREFDGSENARSEWKQRYPDLVFLDLRMPVPDGMEILRWWRQNPEIAGTRVVVISLKEESKHEVESMGAEFWSKRDDPDEFKRKLRNLVQSLPRYRKPYSEHLMRFHLKPGEVIRASVSGNDVGDEQSNARLSDDFARATRISEVDDYLRASDWLAKLQERGQILYRQVFADPLQVLFGRIRGSAQKNENLRLQFTIPLSATGVGLETLFDRPAEVGGKFLALHHPLACAMDGLQSQLRFSKLNRDNLNEVTRRGSKLRALLVAANLEDTVLPPLDAVDAEVEVLAREMPKWFKQNGIELDTFPVLSKGASLECLQDLVARDHFDILHFAGHASNQGTEQAGLYMWDKTGAKRDQYLLSLPELEKLVRDMNASFVFLNCCRGGAQEPAHRIPYTLLQGMTHAIITGGTCPVLAHRSFVRDGAASEFAIDFYRCLAERGETDLAALDARQAAYRRSPSEPIWLGAMLFNQRPL